jgi:hypothetical protein
MIGFGSCCACGSIYRVRHILQMPYPGPTPGQGWGCFLCGLDANGALAVICDPCFAKIARDAERCRKEGRTHDPRAFLRYVCTGFPGEPGRTPIEQLSSDRFEHDTTIHNPGQ